jgi:hypothetical protein
MYSSHRFATAATLTVEEQRRSKSYSDKVIAWVIEVVSTHRTFAAPSNHK